ncbi:hypothetical protein CY34DRAFT_710026 [Suillus luteus UH-Slu-Lm8-n1]|uniref:Uncharacterized protein n=1 Tax=Suillus luteus UH-Slu-Lm8-n1 TaxID=930992 RepID=A0A0D0BJR2_9AGAM|nr:hypothetical protein CY34DRAFT_710026 [Suillus luteus UH-Slu-Lm8-n1]
MYQDNTMFAPKMFSLTLNKLSCTSIDEYVSYGRENVESKDRTWRTSFNCKIARKTIFQGLRKVFKIERPPHGLELFWITWPYWYSLMGLVHAWWTSTVIQMNRTS